MCVCVCVCVCVYLFKDAEVIIKNQFPIEQKRYFHVQTVALCDSQSDAFWEALM